MRNSEKRVDAMRRLNQKLRRLVVNARLLRRQFHRELKRHHDWRVANAGAIFITNGADDLETWGGS